MIHATPIFAAHQAQLLALQAMTQKALATVEELSALNLEATRASLAHKADHNQELLRTQSLQDLIKLQNKALEPLAEQAQAYNRRLYKIASSLHTDLSDTVQAHMDQARKQFVDSVETAMKNVPQSSEPMVKVIKQALTSATTAMDTVQKTVQQAVDTAHVNMGNATEAMVKATKTSRKTA